MINELEDIMLTTIDNPFDPFTQWEQWYNFDESKGYCTSGYLARIAKTSDNLSDYDQKLAITQAINEILELNILGLYTKVTRTSKRTTNE